MNIEGVIKKLRKLNKNQLIGKVVEQVVAYGKQHAINMHLATENEELRKKIATMESKNESNA